MADGPEQVVKTALARALDSVRAAEEDVTRIERELSQAKGRRDLLIKDAERLHAGLVALLPDTTEAVFPKYQREHHRANPR